MGLIHKREYEDILDELKEGLLLIDNFFDFFEMNEKDWNSLSPAQQRDLAETLGDDLFFALATSPSIKVGKGEVQYIEAENVIKLNNNDKLVKLVNLT